ncbi:hypothetical protein [Streptomyces sp. NPDC051576]
MVDVRAARRAAREIESVAVTALRARIGGLDQYRAAEQLAAGITEG